MNTEAQLAARVKARNRCHQVANELWVTFTEIFAPLVGQKLLTVNGAFLAKIDKMMPELPELSGSFGLSVFRYPSAYNLCWTVKCSESVAGECYCVYEEVTFYVADLEGQNMGELSTNHEDFRTDFSAVEITRLRKDYEEKKKIAEKAKSALFPFGEIDR